MALKDLLVLVDDGPESAARIDAAALLATRHDAHLTGLYAAAPLVLPGHIDIELPEAVRALQRQAFQDNVESARRLFHERVALAGLTDRSEWRAVRGNPNDVVATHGRYADLIVVGQVDRHHRHDLPLAQPEDLVFACGRPLLVIPYAGRVRTIGERVMVAWNAGRESARAVNDAMGILEKAHKVTVLAVNPRNGPSGLGDEPGADIARHLSRHGVRAESAHITTDALDPGDTVLNEIADQSCDLLVMGAYGRSRLREMVLGGMTHHMLQHMTVPVLMSH